MIKSTGAAQGGPQQEPASDSSNGTVPQPPLSPLPPVQGTEVEPLSRLEKRRHLAQIVRVNLLDCFDDSGAFDLAQRVLPPCAVQSLIVHETTKTDKAGNVTVQRRITLRLVDKVRAMRLDDALEEKQEKAAHADAIKKIAHLEKALTEADDRELQSSRDMEEKDRQLEALQRALQLTVTTASAVAAPESPAPEPAKGPESSDPEPAEGPEEQAAAQRRSWEEMAIQSKIREIEHLKNTSGHRAFSLRYPKWPEEAEARRAYALRLIKAEAEAAERQKIASAQRAAELAARPTRPPRRLPPLNFAVQDKPMFY